MRLFSTLLLLTICLFAQSADVSPEIQQRAQRNANVYRNLSAQSTTGAQLRAERIEVKQLPGAGKLVHFRLYASGVPHDVPYHLLMIRINGSAAQSPPDPKIVEESGLVADSPGDSHDLYLAAAKGEPYYFALISDDKKVRVFTSVIPFPIKAEDKKCSIEVVRLTVDFEQALVRFTEFPPDAKIQIESDSAGEKRGFEAHTDKLGSSDVTILPYKKDTEKGDLMLKASSGTCSPTIRFTWGKNTYRTE